MVNEPVVPYYIFGVVLIATGALMTFSGRYRAAYGLWNPEKAELQFALVPRFRRNFDEDEFHSLVSELSGGTYDPSKIQSADNEVEQTEETREPEPVGAG